jgi:hypothetical protein
MPTARIVYAGAAIITGSAVGWLVPAHLAIFLALLVVLAAANGYSKAYSP